ncbi:MAG: copper chaperone [Haliscomenobacteraceae bacterium CHB4]|nr:copper chaperone [Haliscomenobacteraceae bacterium CHB4]
MKILIFICIAALSAHSAYAQQPVAGAAPVKKVATAATATQTAQFQVWGNCGMCKRTIETAAKGVTGVQSANWNMDTHQFTVVFDPAQTGVDKVHEAIAAAGYDTDVVKGKDEAYTNLPGCCQYDRRQ